MAPKSRIWQLNFQVPSHQGTGNPITGNPLKLAKEARNREQTPL